MERVLDLINAKDKQDACSYTVQIINKVLRIRMGEEDYHVCDISDGTSYFAAFFRHQPGGPPALLKKYRICAYHSILSPSRKIVVDAYEAPFEYGDDPTETIGAPKLLDVVAPEQVATGSLSATAFAEEDACVPYDTVILGQSTGVSICGRLLSGVGEKTYGGGAKLRMFCTIFYRGKCAKITVFDTQLQSTLKAMRLGDCLMLSRFTAEKPSDFDKGATISIVANRGCVLKTFTPVHEIDVVHRIDEDVIPYSSEVKKYVTLLVRVDELSDVITTRNGKNMRKLTLCDGGLNSIKIALFGAMVDLPFKPMKVDLSGAAQPKELLLLANVLIQDNTYENAKSVDVNQFSSFIIFEKDLVHCGSVIAARAELLRKGESSAENNGGIPPDEPDAYGVHAPLE